MQSVPSDVSPEEYHEFLLWKQFQEQKAAEALRASLQVSIEPVETDSPKT